VQFLAVGGGCQAGTARTDWVLGRFSFSTREAGWLVKGFVGVGFFVGVEGGGVLCGFFFFHLGPLWRPPCCLPRSLGAWGGLTVGEFNSFFFKGGWAGGLPPHRQHPGGGLFSFGPLFFTGCSAGGFFGGIFLVWVPSALGGFDD